MTFPRPLTLFLAAVLTMASVSVSAQEVINNGPKPERGLVQAGMRELWRLGGQDEDLFFGTVVRIVQDAEGTFYLLDGQLSEAHIISPEGEHVATVGRQGTGPGEMQQPGDMFITPDGNINCLTGFPGKVVTLSPNGAPAGITQMRVDGHPMPFGVLLRGLATREGLILAGIRMEFGNSPVSKQNYFLAHCDMEGNLLHEFLTKQNTIDYSQFAINEEDNDFAAWRMSMSPDDHLFVNPGRDVYRIQVLDLQGHLVKIINREFKAPQRTAEQRKAAEQIIDGIAGYHPVPLQSKSICDSEPVIGQLVVTNDGRIWTTPAVDEKQLPDGTWHLLDVFSPEGKFERQIALEGNFNRNRDAAFVMPDGKIVVVTDALDAFLNQMNVAGEDTAEVDPLEVICFELEM